MKYYYTILKKGKFEVIFWGDKSDFLAKNARNMRKM